MIQSKNFNDTPILTPEDDRFGIDPFAQALTSEVSPARAIKDLRSIEGLFSAPYLAPIRTW